ncbi:MAG TPA: phosphatase PAP2 family protein [Cellulomonas sp.]|uniref:phosphatase PAP2 family protein n=1 Tax=Cellulomonas sp. TaxID=40001 RepID=UPI002E30616A|nr:phosphatase PAP2 family protein [Cellulomonas sp.]HEX5333516.1 phosphatase PAP2 family protein [Cellulomonas sp.]
MPSSRSASAVPSHRGPSAASDGPRDRSSGKAVALRLAGGAVGIWAVIALIGLLITHVISPDGPPSWDARTIDWLVAHRTPTMNTATHIGSSISDTYTAIAVTVVVVLLLRWRLGRWFESWIVVAAIAGELLVFVAITATVHRARPAVERLDPAPPTSSFPSGHTAAAIALYGCVAILLLVLWPGVASRLAGCVLFAVPFVVGFSRLYRGMHFPSDVLFGAIGGALWLAVVITTLLPLRPSHGTHARSVRAPTAAR